MRRSIVLLVSLVLPLFASAHPGKTDRHGGHQCLKDCAEWDLYYREYHTHDKDGKPVKTARKNAVRRARASEETAGAAVSGPAPAETASLSPEPAPARASVQPPEEDMPWSWALLPLLLLLFLVVLRRRKRETSLQ